MSAKKAAKKRVVAPVSEPVAPEPANTEPVNVPVEPEVTEPVTGEQNDNPHITVFDTRGNPHRTYSLVVHGNGFRELAEEYVSTRPGWSLR